MTADEILMEEYQKGSRDAFDELYRRYAPRVLGYLRKKGLSPYQAEEVFQQVFFKLHRARQRFDRKFAFSSWIFSIAHNALVDFFRQNQRAPAELEDEPAAPEPGGEAVPVSLESLNPEERRAVHYRYADEKSYGEISALLGISEENARQKVSRAIRKLRDALGRKSDE